MSITIKETIERQCCTGKDMRPYQGALGEDNKRFVVGGECIEFCIHCGQVQVHREGREPSEPSGSLIGVVHLRPSAIKR